MVRVENSAAMLKGSSGARIFCKGRAPFEVASGARLDDLVRVNASEVTE
jgi:hypothetical protein